MIFARVLRAAAGVAALLLGNAVGTATVTPTAAAAAAIWPVPGVTFPPSSLAPDTTSGGVVDVTAAPFNADPTGVADATDALTRAYNSVWLPTQCPPSPGGAPPAVPCLLAVNQRLLYFPSGVYRLTRTLEFTVPRSWGGMELDNMIHFQGHSAADTVIRLDDNADGFGSAADPKPVVSFIHAGNQSNVAMMNTFKDITIDVGVGNHGANALRFTANNCGAVRRVVLRGDGGNIGLDLTVGLTGLALSTDVTITGFRFGAAINSTHPGHVLERVAMSRIASAGIVVYDNQVAVRRLSFSSSSPSARAVWVTRSGRGMAVLIDSDVSLAVPQPSQPGRSGARRGAAQEPPCAVDVTKGFAFLRNVTVRWQHATKAQARGDGHTANNDNPRVGRHATRGSMFAVCNGTALTRLFPPAPGSATATVDEWSSHGRLGVLGGSGRSLRLPVADTPEPAAGDPSAWADVTAFGAVPGDRKDDTAAVQRALNSGAATVFFPPAGRGAYDVVSPLAIPPTVRVVEMLWSRVNVTHPPSAGRPGAFFRAAGAASGASAVTVIRHGLGGPGFTYWLEMADARTVALVELMGSQKLAFNSAPGGQLFIEASCCGAVREACVNLTGGVQAHGRAFDPEADPSPTPKVLLTGAGTSLWVLGFKTEGPTTDFAVRDGASLELLGGELNRFRGQGPGDEWEGRPSFEVTNGARASVVAAEYGPNPPLTEVFASGVGGSPAVNVTPSSFPQRCRSGGGAVDVVMPSWSCC